MLCRSRKKTKMRRPAKGMKRSEDSLRRGETLWVETNTNWKNWARGSKKASEKDTERNVKKRCNRFLKNSEASRVYHAQNLEGKERSSRKWQISKAVFGEFYSKLYAETQPGEEAQKSQNMEKQMDKEKGYSEGVKKEIPEFTQDEAQTAIGSLKKVKEVTTRIRAEDIKTCDETTKEWSDLQRSVEARGLHTSNMEKNTHKCDLQLRKCGRGWMDTTARYSASVVQTVLNHLQQTLQQTRPSAIRRPGRI